MNDKGVSYNGSKKLSTLTGQEEVYDVPVQTVEGEDIGNLPALNINEATEVTVNRSLIVEGGPDKKVISEFGGPVIVNNKLTSTSEKGIEAQSYYVQGDQTVSRKHTLVGTNPTLSGNPGDVSFYSDPGDGEHVGWIYTKENAWRRFGNVSLNIDKDAYTFDQIGIGTTNPGVFPFQVGSGGTIFHSDGIGNVGIATTVVGQYKLYVVGSTNIVGTITATNFSGDGSGLTGVSVPQSGWTIVSGVNSITYNTYDGLIGIGTSTPTNPLTVGSASDDGAVGVGTTTLWVNGQATFNDRVQAKDVNITGIVTASDFDLQSTSGNVTVGVVTATNIEVGTSATIFATSTSGVGIGTTVPRAVLDVIGHTRLETYSENVGVMTVVGTAATVYLDEAQTFTFEPQSTCAQFVLQNIPSGSTSFTIKITQPSGGGIGVGIDTFKDASGTEIPIYWPGGVVPVVTTTASKTDIYSFKCFDGDNLTSVGLYGVIGGQNYG